MLRTHTCGELRTENIGQTATITGWVQKVRNKGGLIWIDVRDRYGLTQAVLEEGETAAENIAIAKSLGREFVVEIIGEVVARFAKNDKMPTGDIEIKVAKITITNAAKVPPFKIEDQTDGGEDLRMKYRYLDLRRKPIREALQLRHKVGGLVRNYLDNLEFIEVETPVLIKSTPEGARDFLVPSRMNKGQFYALPQSPQTFKQILMVSGFDRYYQIVKCFRDEDLRADRQPEFTQIDCEMSFVTQEDILSSFEGMMKHLFQEIKNVTLPEFPRMPFSEAMRLYGNDKPDIRFGMQLADFTELTQNKGFKVFDEAELVVAIAVEDCAKYTRKELDKLTDWVKRPQIGSRGLIYVKCNEDGTFKSSVDKFFNQDDLKQWAAATGAKKGDLILVLSGSENQARKAMSELRLEMGGRLGFKNPEIFAPLWVTDFPLLEQDEETQEWHAMHHPFTSPKTEDEENLMNGNIANVRANAYDMVINGVEVGGGSIRIHDRGMQEKMFSILGFTKEEAQTQFGFLMEAFEYGAPPHGGIAFGFDRLCSLFGGTDSIRDFIAFPKNTSGRDVMIDSPSPLDNKQLEELHIQLREEEK